MSPLGPLLLALQLAATTGQAAPLEIHTSRVQLNPEDWSQKSVGQLEWCGGLELAADRDDFGGLSGLLLSDDGLTLTAVSDRGQWFSAPLVYDGSGCLKGLGPGLSGPLPGPNGRTLSSKSEGDAEALDRTPAGDILVAFEHDHRIWRYAKAERPLVGRPAPLPPAPGFETLPVNRGIEALVSLADGRVLALAESESPDGGYRAFLGDGGRWIELRYGDDTSFAPSGATRLPSGDLIVAERYFTMLGGLKLRLTRVSARSLEPGKGISGREIAVLAPPLTLDNFEGIAAHRGPDGQIRVTLISDDNFSPLQRSLLLMFKLQE